MIFGFCKMGMLDKVLEVWSIMVESRVLLSIGICNIIVNVYCREGMVEEVL